MASRVPALGGSDAGPLLALQQARGWGAARLVERLTPPG
jgi:hypothetical protein